MKETTVILQSAKRAAAEAFDLTTERKNAALKSMSAALLAAKDEILSANETDLKNARGKISEVMLDRLSLNGERIESMAKGIRALIDLPDPTGRVTQREERENGLIIEKVSVPFGVVAIIYESRPNVTSDAAALCSKAETRAFYAAEKRRFSRRSRLRRRFGADLKTAAKTKI